MSRFVLTLSLHDKESFDGPLQIAIGIDETSAIRTLRMSPRSIDMAKAGFVSTMDEVVELIRTKEFRKDLFKQECTRLGVLLAERMEDAEGWHDASRIEPARKELGGRW